MIIAMPSIEMVLVFMAAALALNLTPGPDMLYVTARSVSDGRAAGDHQRAESEGGALLPCLPAAVRRSRCRPAGAADPVAWLPVQRPGDSRQCRRRAPREPRHELAARERAARGCAPASDRRTVRGAWCETCCGEQKMNYTGGCHCDGIKFEVEGDFREGLECNCSICSRKGSLLGFVPQEKLRMLTPKGAMGTYTFNKHVI